MGTQSHTTHHTHHTYHHTYHTPHTHISNISTHTYLWQEIVPFCHVVEHVVGVYSSIHVSPQHLEAWPEGEEGVHEGASHAARRVHAHIHQQGATGDILHYCIIVLCGVCEVCVECSVWGGRWCMKITEYSIQVP